MSSLNTQVSETHVKFDLNEYSGHHGINNNNVVGGEKEEAPTFRSSKYYSKKSNRVSVKKNTSFCSPEGNSHILRRSRDSDVSAMNLSLESRSSFTTPSDEKGTFEVRASRGSYFVTNSSSEASPSESSKTSCCESSSSLEPEENDLSANVSLLTQVGSLAKVGQYGIYEESSGLNLSEDGNVHQIMNHCDFLMTNRGWPTRCTEDMMSTTSSNSCSSISNSCSSISSFSNSSLIASINLEIEKSEKSARRSNKNGSHLTEESHTHHLQNKNKNNNVNVNASADEDDESNQKATLKPTSAGLRPVSGGSDRSDRSDRSNLSNRSNRSPSPAPYSPHNYGKKVRQAEKERKKSAREKEQKEEEKARQKQEQKEREQELEQERLEIRKRQHEEKMKNYGKGKKSPSPSPQPTSVTFKVESPTEDHHSEEGDVVTDEMHTIFKQIFDKLDTRRRGSINVDDLSQGLGSLGLDITDDDFKSIVEDIDTTGTGQINFEDFVGAMTKTDQFIEAFVDDPFSAEKGVEMGEFTKQQNLLFSAITTFAMEHSMKEVERYYATKAKKAPANLGDFLVYQRLEGLTERQLEEILRKGAERLMNSKHSDSPYAQPLPYIFRYKPKKSKKKKKKKKAEPPPSEEAVPMIKIDEEDENVSSGESVGPLMPKFIKQVTPRGSIMYVPSSQNIAKKEPSTTRSGLTPRASIAHPPRGSTLDHRRGTTINCLRRPTKCDKKDVGPGWNNSTCTQFIPDRNAKTISMLHTPSGMRQFAPRGSFNDVGFMLNVRGKDTEKNEDGEIVYTRRESAYFDPQEEREVDLSGEEPTKSAPRGSVLYASTASILYPTPRASTFVMPKLQMAADPEVQRRVSILLDSAEQDLYQASNSDASKPRASKSGSMFPEVASDTAEAVRIRLNSMVRRMSKDETGDEGGDVIPFIPGLLGVGDESARRRSSAMQEEQRRESRRASRKTSGSGQRLSTHSGGGQRLSTFGDFTHRASNLGSFMNFTEGRRGSQRLSFAPGIDQASIHAQLEHIDIPDPEDRRMSRWNMKVKERKKKRERQAKVSWWIGPVKYPDPKFKLDLPRKRKLFLNYDDQYLIDEMIEKGKRECYSEIKEQMVCNANKHFSMLKTEEITPPRLLEYFNQVFDHFTPRDKEKVWEHAGWTSDHIINERNRYRYNPIYIRAPENLGPPPQTAPGFRAALPLPHWYQTSSTPSMFRVQPPLPPIRNAW